MCGDDVTMLKYGDDGLLDDFVYTRSRSRSPHLRLLLYSLYKPTIRNSDVRFCWCCQTLVLCTVMLD